MTLQTSGMHRASRFCRFAIEKWIFTEENVRKMNQTTSFSKDNLCVAFQSLSESRLKHSVFTWQLLTCWKSELVLKRRQVGIKITGHFQVEATRSVWFPSEPFSLFTEVIVKLDEQCCFTITTQLHSVILRLWLRLHDFIISIRLVLFYSEKNKNVFH